MTLIEVLEKFNTPEFIYKSHKLFGRLVRDLINNKKRNSEIIKYISVRRGFRASTCNEEGDLIPAPGAFPDPGTGHVITGRGINFGEIFMVQKFSDKLSLLANKKILPVSVFALFVKKEMDPEFTDLDEYITKEDEKYFESLHELIAPAGLDNFQFTVKDSEKLMKAEDRVEQIMNSPSTEKPKKRK